MKKKLSNILPLKRFEEITSNFKKVKIGVLGDIMLDTFVWGDVKRISPEAPVPVVEIKKEDFRAGGAGNVAMNIKTLGGEVFLISCIGKDENGKILSRLLKNSGVENHLLVRENIPTITKTRVIARTQQLVRIDKEEIKHLSPSYFPHLEEVIETKIKNLGGIIISDYGKGFITPFLIEKLRKITKKEKKFLTVDPKVEHFFYYKNVTCLTPNKFEASAGIHLKEPENIFEVKNIGEKIVRKLKPENLLITLGKEGMILFDKKNKIFHIPTVAKEVFDVTGAGDTVIAVLTLSLASGGNILESSIIANYAAGIVVGKLGTSALTLEELKDSFKENFTSTYLEQIK